MSFAKLFRQSNSSLYSLRGNVIECSIEHTRGNILFLETGLKSATPCFQSELKPTFESEKQNDTLGTSKRGVLYQKTGGTKVRRRRQSGDDSHPGFTPLGLLTSDFGGETSVSALRPALPFNKLNVGIEDLEVFGEPKILLPKYLQTIRKRKLVWAELTKVWRGSHNRIRGFIMNSVNGGYAVAIAGHIAFLPKSLRLDRKIFHSQLRFFSILNMNPKIRNIVVKELPRSSVQKRTRAFSSSSKIAGSRVIPRKDDRKRKAKSNYVGPKVGGR